MIRLFAALSIPPEIARSLQVRQAGIEGARWRPIESLHVTLRFFGEIRQDVARDLDSELMGLGGRPFEIVLEGAGSFADSNDINAVWAGVTGNAELRRLAEAVEGAARRVGLKPEKRNYRPHVTLAYLRHPDPGQVAAWIQANNLLKSPPITVDRFGLYSSTLGREGSHYRLEAEYLL
jgi:2'-5' RNA ligase